MTSPTARLLIACPDASGIVAAVTGFIADRGGNLIDAEQHTDAEHGEFTLRVEFTPAGSDELDPSSFAAAWLPLSQRHDMAWRIAWTNEVKRMVILVSRSSHCLQDLLWRWQAGELAVEIPAIISNHDDLRPIAEQAGIPFHYLPVDATSRAAQEAQIRNILETERTDFAVLARYMQILTPRLLAGWENRFINIHHSFLPAFAGGDPYRQAWERGVKIIGATSHYVTEDLDEGPIIAQDVDDVSHHDAVADLRRKGRDLERVVLARAVRAHVEDKVLVSGRKTVVFR